MRVREAARRAGLCAIDVLMGEVWFLRLGAKPPLLFPLSPPVFP